MRPEELVRLLTSMRVAADVVEALDSPALQVERCWDLAGWSYETVPFGVRFVYRDGRNQVTATIVAVLHAEAHSDELLRADSSRPTTLLLLG